MSFLDKISELFGEKERSHPASPLETWMKIPRLHHLLPYEGYCSETKLFFNRHTTSFILWSAPA